MYNDSDFFDFFLLIVLICLLSAGECLTHVFVAKRMTKGESRGGGGGGEGGGRLILFREVTLILHYFF